MAYRFVCYAVIALTILDHATTYSIAVMMMPPNIRMTFMPNPPLRQLPPVKSKRRKKPTDGVFSHMEKFETTKAPERVLQPTPKSLKAAKIAAKIRATEEKRKASVEEYRKFQRDCGGEYEGMNCYNTLFVGRLAYEVNERKLLREMEVFGPVKDIKLVKDKEGKSKGIAFVEYENEEDMKRAYRGADRMRIEGREIVVDVERGHTVPTWLPRRLGGGLGGTRLGGKDQNVTAPGRYDPAARSMAPLAGEDRGPPPGYYNSGPPPPQNYGGGYGGDYRGGDRDRRRRRSRSRSPERGRYEPRRRY